MFVYVLVILGSSEVARDLPSEHYPKRDLPNEHYPKRDLPSGHYPNRTSLMDVSTVNISPAPKVEQTCKEDTELFYDT